MATNRSPREAAALARYDYFRAWDRRPLLEWILGGLGTDASRSAASWELFWRFGCSQARRQRLERRGWWAARPADDSLAF